MYFIVAGTFREYQDFVTKKLKEFPNLTSLNFKFVRDAETLLGLSYVKGFFVGTYEKREDIKEIEQAIYLIKARKEIVEYMENYRYD